MEWVILIIKSTNVSSRDRMFIWRNIKNTAAVSLSHSVYLLRNTEENRATASNIEEIVHKRNGEVLKFFADAFNEEQKEKLNKLIIEEITAEIKEFSTECESFVSDVAERISNKKFMVYELEELNDDLHKLDKWRIKLIQKHRPPPDKIEILNKMIAGCKDKLKDFEEKILRKSIASDQ